jgi:hypothetical protein
MERQSAVRCRVLKGVLMLQMTACLFADDERRRLSAAVDRAAEPGAADCGQAGCRRGHGAARSRRYFRYSALQQNDPRCGQEHP